MGISLRSRIALSFAASLVVLVASGAAFAQTGAGPLPSSPALQRENSLQELQRDLGDIFADPNFSNAFWGVCIQSMSTGQYYFRLNDTRSFLPASNMKLMTAAEALTALGPQFKYTTELLTTGRISEHTLRGDLIVRGSGDPTFGVVAQSDSLAADVFATWAESLKAQGITRIEGNLIGDDSYFPDQPYPIGWAVEDLPYYYAMPTSALSYAENAIAVSAMPSGTPGAKARIELSPATRYVTVESEATTKADSLVKHLAHGRDTVLAAGSNSIEITRKPGSNTISVTGQIPVSGTAAIEQLSVEEPTLYAMNAFRDALEAHGIRVVGSCMSAQDLDERIPYLKARVLAQHTSASLAQIVAVMNKESDNMYAEQLFRTVAKEQLGEGSWSKGIDAMKSFLLQMGIAPERVSITDGSGLSRMDLLSPLDFVTLLRTVYQQRKIYDPLYASLPVMGVDGTLAHRLTNTAAAGNVHAKTGFLTGVRSISGYLTTRDSELIAFSMIVNNFTTPTSLANNLQDLVLLRLVNFSMK